jgi:hypothetical protein
VEELPKLTTSRRVAGQIIGMQLVTPQTSAEGKKSAQSFSC